MKNRKQKSVYEKMLLTYTAFHQHVKRENLQSIKLMENPEHFGQKFDNPIDVGIVISFALCNLKINFSLLVFVGQLFDYMENQISR